MIFADGERKGRPEGPRYSGTCWPLAILSFAPWQAGVPRCVSTCAASERPAGRHWCTETDMLGLPMGAAKVGKRKDSRHVSEMKP